MKRSFLCLACLAAATTLVGAQTNATITAVEGIKVGHHTLAERPTGCTVILVDGDAVGGVSQRGGAPGTRETDLLNPLNMVDKVNAVVLAGGSAFGLEAATGAVRWLEEHNIGWPAGPSRVPIVPAAILFDLGVGGNPKIRPNADCGYKAAAAATTAPVAEGTIGAGAGATVGKLGGAGRSTKSGLGSASITLPSGLVVAAIVQVHAVATSSIRRPARWLRRAQSRRHVQRCTQNSASRRERAAAASRREHHHRSCRDQRQAVEITSHPHGADGRRRICASDQPVAYQR
jgi:L-aminopeptidase/D-esterase-like protein